ncbi:MAG: ABC transporter permease subunit [Actinobacteria bacterium]|nr:ABC transporter permease subunit [Actinomycetota bacterium]
MRRSATSRGSSGRRSSIPGASSFYVEAARTRDTPVLLGVTVVLAIFVIVANTIADIVLALLDPRVLERR